MNIKAVIFDFNGTLYFDSDYHVQAWDEMAKIITNQPLDDQLRVLMHGKNNEEIIRLLKPGIDDVRNKAYSLQKEAMYRKMCMNDQENLHLVEGAIALFQYLKQENIPFTIASASIKENIDFFIETFGLDEYFDVDAIIYDDGNYMNKVDMFTTACRRFHIEPCEAMVIEDSVTGTSQAKQTGIGCIIGMMRTENNQTLVDCGAHACISDFTQFDYNLLKERGTKTMEATEIIQFIRDSKKKTQVKVYVSATEKITFDDVQQFGCKKSPILIGEWDVIAPQLEANKSYITDYYVENNARNSAIPLLDLKGINARIEPGAIIRDQVEIGDNAVIMMGATINIGAIIGAGTMIDMGAILGGRATVGKNCHIGAGTVLAGVIEPASATPVIVEDGVLIGANAVVIEGCRIGAGSVVAAGAVVIEDVPAGVVVAGCPAKIIKEVDDQTSSKTGLEEGLRKI